jgi:hypothetical protein
MRGCSQCNRKRDYQVLIDRKANASYSIQSCDPAFCNQNSGSTAKLWEQRFNYYELLLERVNRRVGEFLRPHFVS